MSITSVPIRITEPPSDRRSGASQAFDDCQPVPIFDKVTTSHHTKALVWAAAHIPYTQYTRHVRNRPNGRGDSQDMAAREVGIPSLTASLALCLTGNSAL